MRKDRAKYKVTGGWGFEGFKGDSRTERMVTDAKTQCFGCHATAAVTGGKLNPASAMPGISCEGCHGPGAAHVALAHAGADRLDRRCEAGVRGHVQVYSNWRAIGE